MEKAAELTLALLLLFSVLFASASFARANFIPGYMQVKIDSPTAQIYQLNTVSLAVTIYTFHDYYANGSGQCSRWVGYSLDGQNNVTVAPVFLHGDESTKGYSWVDSFYVVNATLTGLANGEHKLTVYAENRYSPNIGGYTSDNPYVMSSLANVTFIIDSTSAAQTPDPSSIALPSSTVPEFSLLTILPILLAIPIVLSMVRKRLQRNL